MRGCHPAVIIVTIGFALLALDLIIAALRAP